MLRERCNQEEIETYLRTHIWAPQKKVIKSVSFHAKVRMCFTLVVGKSFWNSIYGPTVKYMYLWFHDVWLATSHVSIQCEYTNRYTIKLLADIHHISNLFSWFKFLNDISINFISLFDFELFVDVIKFLFLWISDIHKMKYDYISISFSFSNYHHITPRCPVMTLFILVNLLNPIIVVHICTDVGITN